MANKEPGYVYILTNPSFREDWVKIGKSSHPVDVRSKEEDKKIEANGKESELRAQKPPFKFHMIGLKVGDTVFFDELNLPVTVASDDKVEYQGRLWSLSAFAREFLPEEKQNTSGAYQGPKYFSYEGKTLWKLRMECNENH